MGLFSNSDKYAWVAMNNNQSAWIMVGFVSVSANPFKVATAQDNTKIVSAMNGAFQLLAKKYPNTINDINNSNCLLFGSFEKNDFIVLCSLARRDNTWGIVEEFPLIKITNLKKPKSGAAFVFNK